MRENVELIGNTFSYFGMYQHYPTHTGKGYTLDLAFSTFEEGDFRYVPSLGYLVPFDAAHHEPAFFRVYTGLQCDMEKVHHMLDFRKADYDVMNQILSDISSPLMEDNVNTFYNIINYIVVLNHEPSPNGIS